MIEEDSQFHAMLREKGSGSIPSRAGKKPGYHASAQGTGALPLPAILATRWQSLSPTVSTSFSCTPVELYQRCLSSSGHSLSAAQLSQSRGRRQARVISDSFMTLPLTTRDAQTMNAWLQSCIVWTKYGRRLMGQTTVVMRSRTTVTRNPCATGQSEAERNLRRWSSKSSRV